MARSFAPSSFASTALSEKNGHPCPKPVKVMTWFVNRCSRPGEIIVDPFGGSGTTARAAKDNGRKCIVIEWEEAYCEIAARQMEQESLNLEQQQHEAEPTQEALL